MKSKKVGSSRGLVRECDSTRIKVEQVCVYLENDESHPILVDGAVGYSVPGRMRLTPRQAAELAILLNMAVMGLGKPLVPSPNIYTEG